MTEVYGPCDDGFLEDGNQWCPSYEHTRGLMWVNDQPSFQNNALSGSDGLILPRVLTGIDSTGFASQVAPLTMCFLIAGLWMLYQARDEKVKQWTRRGFTGAIVLWALVPFILDWFDEIGVIGFHLPLQHIGSLFQPLQLAIELFFVGIVFAPILAGLIGIWSLSRGHLLGRSASS
ncbi:MAG: hypothetical protein Ct9H90mP14_1920 [Methanobacteriota archaeon]|nr:MAG: hypothetical protein Ct9H90mP14_1920 [Euryarchaeota archaeon]